MARAIWNGSIGFGLVNVPVHLESATESKDVHFHQVRRETFERVRNQRVGEKTGDVVEYDELVKGYERPNGEWVVIEPEELAELDPRRSRTIEIEAFVDLHQVDPVHFDRTYYVVPAGEGAEKPYALLAKALEETERVAVARFVMRNKEYLATVRADGGSLLLETMYFPDEVRERPKVPSGEVGAKELGVAVQLVDAMAVDWDPDQYHDTYRERVLALIDAKAEGKTYEVASPEEEAPVLDLMAALQASLDRGRGGKGGRSDEAPKGRARAKPRGDDEELDLAALTKAELEDRAKELDIEGRSSMRKDELVAAIRRAS